MCSTIKTCLEGVTVSSCSRHFWTLSLDGRTGLAEDRRSGPWTWASIRPPLAEHCGPSAPWPGGSPPKHCQRGVPCPHDVPANSRLVGVGISWRMRPVCPALPTRPPLSSGRRDGRGIACTAASLPAGFPNKFPFTVAQRVTRSACALKLAEA